MKKILIGIFLFSIWGCTGDEKTQSQQQEQQPPAPQSIEGQSATATSAVADAPRSGDTGSFLPPLKPENHPMVPILTTDFWVFEFYVIEDPAARALNKGRWYRFFEDGTFEAGRWQEKTGYGSWRLQVEEGDVMLYLDNIVDADDIQWEIQGVNQGQDTMTWVGINKTKNTGAITKAINLMTMPTKAQFGVE